MFVGGLLFMSHGSHAPWGFGCPCAVLEQMKSVFWRKTGPGPWVHLGLTLYRGSLCRYWTWLGTLVIYTWMPNSLVYTSIKSETQSFDTLGPCHTIYPWLLCCLILIKALLQKITSMEGSNLSFLSDILDFIPGSSQIIEELRIWTTTVHSLKRNCILEDFTLLWCPKLNLLKWHCRKL